MKNVLAHIKRPLTCYSHRFSSFIESRGQPLLNLSLFVSSENYTEWTRPALAQILQWPSQWIIPHQLRDEAKRGSEHLGLSSLDIETVSEEDGGTNSRGAGNIPRNLVARPKETVVSMLGKSGGQNQFRLDAVTSDVLEPLCDLVQEHGSRSWLFETDKASSLDCLLLGYLSLMSPPLTPPHKWLQDALATNYSPLLQWSTNFRQECFGGPINAADVLLMPPTNPPTSSSNLPWQSPAPISTANIGFTVLAAIYDSLPVISSRSDRIVRAAPPEVQSGMLETTSTVQARSPQYTLPALVCAAFGAAMGYDFYARSTGSSKSTQQTQHPVRRGNGTDQRDFGEAGRMLGLGVI
jgi:sorting and assembly machinery component 37